MRFFTVSTLATVFFATVMTGSLALPVEAEGQYSLQSDSHPVRDESHVANLRLVAAATATAAADKHKELIWL